MSGYGGDPRYAGYQRQPQPWGMYAGAVASPVRGLLETFAPGASDYAAARDSVAYGGQMSSALRRGDWGDAVGPGLLSLAAGLGALPMVPSVVGALKAADNLPMDELSRRYRARDMGFKTTPTYHGTPNIDPIRQEGFSPKRGPYYFADDLSVAQGYTARERIMSDQPYNPGVVEAFLRMENPKRVDMKGGSWQRAEAIIKEAQAAGHDSVIIENVRDAWKGKGKKTTVRVVFDPSQIRSPEAAFDPARRNSRDLLASVGGAGLLGAIAYGDDE